VKLLMQVGRDSPPWTPKPLFAFLFAFLN
jgi:hypothetical protein